MPARPGFSSTSPLSLSTTWLGGPLAEAEAVSGSSDVPNVTHLARLEVELSDIASATSVTFFLSHDTEGLQAITPHSSDGATQDISLSPDDQTAGAVAWTLEDQPFVKRDGLHLWLKLDQGTATATASLTWETVL